MTHGSIVPGRPGYVEHPTHNDRIHSLVLVINAQTVSTMDDGLEKKIKSIIDDADARGTEYVKLCYLMLIYSLLSDLQPMILLTKVDELCTDTAENTKNVYASVLIREKV